MQGLLRGQRMKTLLVAMLSLVALAGCVTEESLPCVEPTFEEGDHNPIVGIETNLGCIYVEVFEDKVPNTALNFVSLVEDGDYDGSPFHRIITNFMMQGGDYTMGNGQGGRAHENADPDGDGNIPDEIHPELRHDKKGILSMAKTAAPNSGGSQFFITFAATPWLDDQHTVFGQVVDGMDVVDAVHTQASSQNGTPVLPVTFVKGTVYAPHAHEEGQ